MRIVSQDESFATDTFTNGECFYFCSYNTYGEKGDCYHGIVNCDCPGNSNSPWTALYYYSTGLTCVDLGDDYYIQINCHYNHVGPANVTCTNGAQGSSTSSSSNASVIVGSVIGTLSFIIIIVAALCYFYMIRYTTSTAAASLTTPSATASDVYRDSEVEVGNIRNLDLPSAVAASTQQPTKVVDNPIHRD